jgi:hypothetical protein
LRGHSELRVALKAVYYENRIPELQLINDKLTDDIAEICGRADLDDDHSIQAAELVIKATVCKGFTPSAQLDQLAR